MNGNKFGDIHRGSLRETSKETKKTPLNLHTNTEHSKTHAFKLNLFDSLTEWYIETYKNEYCEYHM